MNRSIYNHSKYDLFDVSHCRHHCVVNYEYIVYHELGKHLIINQSYFQQKDVSNNRSIVEIKLIIIKINVSI